MAEELSQEQAKRTELLAEYELEVEGPREERNAGIDAHDKEWAERWAKLQGEIDQVKAAKTSELDQEGIPEEKRKGILDMEAARLLEQHDIDRAKAVAELEGKLPQPKKWIDFLEEKALTDGDPTIATLIEEARQNPEPSLGGSGDGIPKPVLTDLVHKVDQAGVHYLRGGREVVHDSGPRLNVKQMDDRDIEAALRIAGQKFDMSQGLVLTGDATFRKRTAEIAGRLGLPIQGHDPVLQAAWDKGRDSVPRFRSPNNPSIERSISGAELSPDLLKPVQIRLDARLAEQSEKLGLKLVGQKGADLLAEMPAERYLGAMAAWRGTSRETLEKLSAMDLKASGELDLGEFSDRHDIMPLFEIDSNELSEIGRDLILVRDAHALESKDHGLEVLTSQDRVAHEAERLQNEKALISRNVDEQAVEKDGKKHHEEIGHEVKENDLSLMDSMAI